MTPEQKAFFQGVGSGVLGESLVIPKKFSLTMAKALSDGHAQGAEHQYKHDGIIFIGIEKAKVPR